MAERTVVNRVPHINLLFWVIKIASTTLGETGADMVSMTFDLGYGTRIAILLGLSVAVVLVAAVHRETGLERGRRRSDEPTRHGSRAGGLLPVELGPDGAQ